MSFIIEEVRREGAKIVIGLSGVSGSGKTYTAILLAYGLVGRDAKKIGFLDTENRRGRLYADILPNREKFKIVDFKAPFSPQRYKEGIEFFYNQGVEVLVIDSISHEWEGVGGCEEIATAGNPKVARWNLAKLEHRRMMNTLLQSPMHIIVCLRAREKVDMKDPRNVRSLGIQPIQEKNFMFEMTASVMMVDEGASQWVLKCPNSLKSILGREHGYLGIEDGEALREWVDGAEPIDKDLERHRSALDAACEYGMEELGKAWKSLPLEVKKKLEPELKQFKSSAEAYDRQREIENGHDPQNDETMDAVSQMLGKQTNEEMEAMPDLM